MLKDLISKMKAMPAPPKGWVTRFAPSPTGYLHLGHALSCAYVFAVGRALGAKILLRLEDHDRQRCQPPYSLAIIEDLEWLGFEFDNLVGSALAPEYIQSQCGDRYSCQFEAIRALGLLYPCVCSRQSQNSRQCQIRGGHLIYDNHCRNTITSPAANPSDDPKGKTWRFVFDHEGFIQECFPQRDLTLLEKGDFSIKDREGNWTYQWSVVLDDLAHGVNLIIRGQDLWSSTLRYTALWRAIQGRDDQKRSPLPVFLHHPLLMEKDGTKLSKSSLAKPLRTWRQDGYAPEQVMAMAFSQIQV
jgi:glutamyl/glutaminyl-tRNA synthetase